MIIRLTAIKIKDGAQQCRINYHDCHVFSCPLSIGTLPKITIVSISAPGKLLILNHLLTDKNATFLVTYVIKNINFFATK